MRTINLLDPAVRANPYPHYAAIRSEAAVCRVEPGEMWAVVRHAEAAYVLREAGLFSSSGLRLLTEHPALEYNPMAESIFVSRFLREKSISISVRSAATVDRRSSQNRSGMSVSLPRLRAKARLA